MASRVVVFGKAGQLGCELVRVLRARGYAVTAFGRADVDVTEAHRVEQVLAGIDPALVVNATAYNAVDRAETDPVAAYEGNALAVRNIALACRQADAQLVHFSTDYVFDGTAGRAYTEDDRPHPLGAYAVSKLAGELYAQAYLSQPLIIRTSGVFGPGGMSTPRGNFLETMLRLAASGQPIRVIQDSVASPTYAPFLAERTIDMVERKLTGLFHVGGGTPISWFDYAGLIFEVAGVKPELRPASEREYRTPARRPKYSVLSNAKMESAGISAMPPLRDAVVDYMTARKQALSSSTRA